METLDAANNCVLERSRKLTWTTDPRDTRIHPSRLVSGGGGGTYQLGSLFNWSDTSLFQGCHELIRMRKLSKSFGPDQMVYKDEWTKSWVKKVCTLDCHKANYSICGVSSVL